MNLLEAAAAVLALALAGLGVLRLVWSPVCSLPRTARLGLGFCVGTFLVALLLFGAYLLGLPFSRPLLLGPVFLLAIVGAATCRGPLRPIRLDLAVGTATLLVLLALALSWARPVYGYDAISMWALKAKVAFFAGTWPPTLFDPHTTHHPNYPPLVPAAQAFVFFWMNACDDLASRVVFAAFFASGAAILWWWLGAARVASRGLWLLWWCALPVLMQQIRISYADLPLAAALLPFLGGIVLWLRTPADRHWLRLASLFAGLAFWVKQDALLAVGSGFFALALVAWRRQLPWRPVAASLASAVLIAAPWWLLAAAKHLPGDFTWPSADWPARAGLVARALFRYGVGEDCYAFFWPLCAATLIFRARRLRQTEHLWLAVTIATTALGVFVVYLCSTLELSAQLQTSTDRILLNVFAPALLLTGLLWRGSFRWWRRGWQWFALTGVLVLIAAAVARGLYRKSDEEILGVTISPFPLALSWVWVATAVITLAKFIPRLKRRGWPLAWRALQFGVTVATLGLAVVAVAVAAQGTGESWRRFGGKSLAARHALTLDPLVREKLAAARAQFPPGTHVHLLATPARRYHQFQYAAYPWLIVDRAAPDTITIASPAP